MFKTNKSSNSFEYIHSVTSYMPYIYSITYTANNSETDLIDVKIWNYHNHIILSL